MDWLARLLGVFYIFGGIMVLRHMAMDRLMDATLTALTGDPTSANESKQSQLLIVGALLTFASGLALSTLSRTAFAVFVVNTLVQGGYLLWAGKALPPTTTEEATGRRQTRNAFGLFCVATAFVAYLAYHERLRPWPYIPGNLLGLFAETAVITLCTLAVAWKYLRPAKEPPASTDEEPMITDDEISETALSDPAGRTLRLAPEFACHPLWDDATGENLEAALLPLPSEWIARLERWDRMFQRTYNPVDPRSSRFPDEATRIAYNEEGRAIARALEEIWPGKIVVRLISEE